MGRKPTIKKAKRKSAKKKAVKKQKAKGKKKKGRRLPPLPRPSTAPHLSHGPRMPDADDMGIDTEPSGVELTESEITDDDMVDAPPEEDEGYF